MGQLLEPVDYVVYSNVQIILCHFWVKLSDIDQLILVILLINLLMPFENVELFFQVFADSIKLYLILICIFVETKDDVFYFFFFAIFVVLLMAPALVLFEEGIRSKHILKLLGDAISNIAYKVSLLVMSFELFVIFVVNVFQFGRVDVADLALVV